MLNSEEDAIVSSGCKWLVNRESSEVVWNTNSMFITAKIPEQINRTLTMNRRDKPPCALFPVIFRALTDWLSLSRRVEAISASYVSLLLLNFSSLTSQKLEVTFAAESFWLWWHINPILAAGQSKCKRNLRLLKRRIHYEVQVFLGNSMWLSKNLDVYITFAFKLSLVPIWLFYVMFTFPNGTNQQCCWQILWKVLPRLTQKTQAKHAVNKVKTTWKDSSVSSSAQANLR